MTEQERQAWLQRRNQDAIALEEYRKSGRLTTQIMMIGTLAKTHYDYPDSERARPIPVPTIHDAKQITESVDRLYALVKVFEGAVWYLGGLQAKVNACDARGMSGNAEGWSVLVWSCAGRCLLTLRDATSSESLTLITADDEEPFVRQQWGSTSMGPMGIQGIDCTEATARRFLERAIRGFPELKSDSNVSIA